MSFASVKAVVVLDGDGKRLHAKYYSSELAGADNAAKQASFFLPHLLRLTILILINLLCSRCGIADVDQQHRLQGVL